MESEIINMFKELFGDYEVNVFDLAFESDEYVYYGLYIEIYREIDVELQFTTCEEDELIHGFSECYEAIINEINIKYAFNKYLYLIDPVNIIEIKIRPITCTLTGYKENKKCVTGAEVIIYFILEKTSDKDLFKQKLQKTLDIVKQVVLTLKAK